MCTHHELQRHPFKVVRLIEVPQHEVTDRVADLQTAAQPLLHKTHYVSLFVPSLTSQIVFNCSSWYLSAAPSSSPAIRLRLLVLPV